MIPIEVVALLKVIEHGDDVHKLQQTVPSTLSHSTGVTSISWRLVIMLSSIDDVAVDDVDGDDWLILASPCVLDDDVLDDVVLDDDVVNDGVLNDGVVNDDVLNDGVLNDGVVNDDVVCM